MPAGLALLALLALLSGCAAPPSEPVGLQSATPPASRTRAPSATSAPAPSATLAPTEPPASPTAANQLEQYRRWMEQARELYPYAEPVESMWSVMLCESSGRPDVVAGAHHGLFQYSVETWRGDWNPYRERALDDAEAQIFATAKAWHDGYQSWWSGCLP